MKRGRFILLATLVVVSLGTILWNYSRTVIPIDTSYTARWSTDRDARPSFYHEVSAPRIELNASGVEALEEIILSLQPVRNPLRIGWEHLRYWANERLFPVKIYLDSESSPRLVYYQRGRYVFLRHEQHRHDVVLAGKLLPADVEERLKPFVIGLQPGIPWTGGAVEREPPQDSS